MFRKVAHLQEQLGPERFAILVDSGNTGKVRDFVNQLIRDALSAPLVVGGRTYRFVDFVEKGSRAGGATLLKRAEEESANLGKEDGQYLLDHQGEIPIALRGQVAFVFPGWRHPQNPNIISYVSEVNGCWCHTWRWLDDQAMKPDTTWDDHFRLLRPVNTNS